jgi:hypothetical protein
MIRTAIITQTAAAALCLLLTQHQPAQAGVMQTASNGSSNWTYTAGEGGSNFKFSPIQGTDSAGGSSGGTASLASDPASLPTGTTGSASDPTAVPEPGTLALLAFPLLLGAAVVRRRQQR